MHFIRIDIFLRIPYGILLLCFFICLQIKSQSYVFGEGTVNWNLREPYTIPASADTYSNADLVVLDDHTEFHFYSTTDEKIVRNVKYKINSQKGLETLKHFKTPESFDYAFDSELYKQSRHSRIKTPYINEYNVKIFAARKFTHSHWANVSVKEHYETIRWIRSSGEFSDEDLLVLQLGTLAIGDVLEIYYEANFNAQYGNNIFYFNGPYPKLKCEYDFIYRVGKDASEASFMLPCNLDSAHFYTSRVNYEESVLITTKIQQNNLKANLFPLNSFEAKELPHVCADFRFYRSVASYHNGIFEFEWLVKPKNFEWVVTPDTNVSDYTKIYDKQFVSIRKFMNTLPPIGNDSQNVVFFKALCDTFNNFRFLNPNHLYYNESNLYNLYSGDHILKRRLPGHNAWKLYTDILKDNQLFYYLVNMQDKRLGEHELYRRSHFGYEHSMIALPMKNSYIYFNPRVTGVKYHLNELPFYYEGVLAALIPMNFQPNTKDKSSKIFKMIKTHHGTFNENTRSESSTVNICMDSLLARLSIKESLTGQFSTILRHIYLNELIDSTIAPFYFKKCTDKPKAFEQRVKLSAHITEFPYRYSFNCSEKVKWNDSSKIALKDWFSFPISKITIPQKPNFKYYFDFDFSDNYNFLLDFNKPIDIKNLVDFETAINNDFFSLESKIIQNSPTTYFLKVNFVVKKTSITLEQMSLLMDVLNRLEVLNNFNLELTKH